MNPEEIEKLHEAAVGLYVSGRYAEARRAWEAVLACVPQDERAIEGIRMVRVLGGEWPIDAPGAAVLPEGSTEDELRRIERMLAEASYGDALLAAQRLTEADRGSAGARRLAARALELFEAAPYIDVELTKAKQAAAEGRSEDTRAACQRILSLDPAHAAAAELLTRVDGEAARPASVPVSPPSAAPAKPAPSAAPPAPKAAAPSAPPSAPAKPAPSAMKPPPAGAFFDLTDDDVFADAPPPSVRPLSPPPPAPPGSAAFAADPHEDAVFDATAALASEAKPKDAVSGFRPAVESASQSLFEMPDEDVPTIKTSFSDLEAEIDESQGPSEGEVDFDIPDGEAAPVFTGAASPGSAPAAAQPTTEDEGPIDFNFDEEDFALLDGSTAAAPGAGESGGSSQTPEARIAALLEESRSALRAGRYPEAIEAAARAFAIDPEAQGAQQLIDEARTRQDEADRIAEETLCAGRDKLTAGDLAGAEEAFKVVLRTHPSHREALDGLDQISRRRNESEILGGRPAAKSAPAPEKNAAERASGPAPAEPAWPASEPLTPKSFPDKGAGPAHAPAPRAASPASILAASSATKTKTSASGMGRKLVLIGAILGALVIVVGAGYFALSLFGGKSRPVEKAVLTPHKDPKGIPKPGKDVPRPASSEKPRPDPAALAEGVPRTIPEARRLVSEGKLEAARVVLSDMVRAAPDNIPAVDALKSVQAQIVERDQVAESMDQIRHAYKQERYEDALRMLYRLPSGMQHGDIEQFKANAWYNNGINYLLGGNTTEAVHCFEETLNIDPHDQQAQRLKSYSKTYSDREKDSAFRAFVDQLDKRPIDTK